MGFVLPTQAIESYSRRGATQDYLSGRVYLKMGWEIIRLPHVDFDRVYIPFSDVVTLESRIWEAQVTEVAALPDDEFRALLNEPDYADRLVVVWCEHLKKWCLFNGHHRREAALIRGLTGCWAVQPYGELGYERQLNNWAKYHLRSAAQQKKFLTERSKGVRLALSIKGESDAQPSSV